MGLFIPVDFNQVKDCQLCGRKIVFIEKRVGGLWFPTDVKQDEESGNWGYILKANGKETARSHVCYGDPEDSTTVNGRRKICAGKIQSIKDRIETWSHQYQLARKPEEPDEFKSTDLYKQLLSEYTQVRQEFSDVLG
jgi:hypothetical protein